MAVYDLLVSSARSHADRQAVIADDGSATFRELEVLSQGVACRLHEDGVRRGEKVALLIGNDHALHFNALYFGIHAIGAIPVPLNTRWAPPEVHYVLEHSDAVAVVTSPSRLPVIEPLARGDKVEVAGRPLQLSLQRFYVTGSEPSVNIAALGDLRALAVGTVPALDPPVGAEDPADLLYTSGTTGMPKGVLVPEGDLADQPGQGDLSQVLASLFGSSLLHAVPLYGFTGCHGLMLMSVRSGITQVVLPKFDPEGLLAAIAEHGVTSVMAVPTMLNLVMKHPRLRDYDYRSLQFVFFGAAPIQPATVRQMLEVWPGVRMLNAYGLTEGGPGAACVLGPDPYDILSRPGAVGRPVGCEVVVLADDGSPLPPGEVGEICFRTARPRRSYYKGYEETEELWRNGVLHTGDVGYLSTDGYVYLTDRKKDMILRGGYNIFAIEVERVLLDIPGILEAAVVAVPHADLGEDILAVVVPKPGAVGNVGDLTPERINAFCRQHLADYKCPRHVEFVSELPKNSMAKVLKAELRERYAGYLVS